MDSILNWGATATLSPMKFPCLRHFLLAVFLPAVAVSLFSCDGGKEAKTAPSAPDTGEFVLGITPTMASLPYLYAGERGLYDSLGVDVHIRLFESQADLDTALLAGNVDAALSDVVRAALNTTSSSPLLLLSSESCSWGLVASGKVRLTKVKQLADRLVGIERFSTSDRLLDYALLEAKMKRNAPFRPQLGKLPLRASMLNEGQIEAAVLPEPWLSAAQGKGHKLLTSFPDKEGKGCFGLLAKEKRLRNKDFVKSLQTVLKGRNMMADSLNNLSEKSLQAVVSASFKIEPATLQKLPKKSVEKAISPMRKQVSVADNYLKTQATGRRHGRLEISNILF